MGAGIFSSELGHNLPLVLTKTGEKAACFRNSAQTLYPILYLQSRNAFKFFFIISNKS